MVFVPTGERVERRIVGGDWLDGVTARLQAAIRGVLEPPLGTEVLAAEVLLEGRLVRAQAGEMPVVLLRRGGEVLAIAETCTHLGGPLSEGELDGDVVTCPWHGSRFSLHDGSVRHGPATFPAAVLRGPHHGRAGRDPRGPPWDTPRLSGAGDAPSGELGKW